MSVEETNILNRAGIELSKHGVTTWKNVRGQFFTKDAVKRLMAAVMAENLKRALLEIKTLRLVSAGLQAPGSSDLIGFKRVKITPDMVGQTIAQFCVFEGKTDTGTLSPNQRDFLDFVKENGGRAGVVRNNEDAIKIVS